MNLTVDIGNTTIKLVVFDSSKVVIRYVIAHDDVFDMQDLINTYSIKNSIVSTVTTSEFPWMSLLTKNTHCIRLNHAMRIPFTSSYLPFERLGLDRVVGLAAAASLFPKEDVLVVDAGTCITYDVLNAQAHHLGGSISPGLGMRYRAMHEFTDALPKLDFNSSSTFPPVNTQDAIHHGVLDGTCAEINAFIAQYTQNTPKFKVILTGGDANFLAERLKNGIFAHVDFLAYGLNSLLELNLIE